MAGKGVVLFTPQIPSIYDVPATTLCARAQWHTKGRTGEQSSLVQRTWGAGSRENLKTTMQSTII